MRGECGSCGTPDEDLSPVHRVYLIPELTRLDEIEWWCPSCRSQYPHDDAEG